MNDWDTVDDKYNLTVKVVMDHSKLVILYYSHSLMAFNWTFPKMAFTAFSDETLHMQIVNIND